MSPWALRGNDAIGAFITSSLLPNVDALAFAIKAVELLVGVSLILGIFTRLGAFCGFAIAAASFVFQHGFDSVSGYAGGNFIVLVTMLFLVFAPASRVFAADRLMMRRIAAPPPPPTTVRKFIRLNTYRDRRGLAAGRFSSPPRWPAPARA